MIHEVNKVFLDCKPTTKCYLQISTFQIDEQLEK